MSIDVSKIQHSEIVRILKKKNKTRNDLEILSAKFDKIKFFAESKEKVDEESYMKLLKSLSYETKPANQSLFRKGDHGDKFYIILTGEIKVILDFKEDEIVKTDQKDKKKFVKMFNEYHSELGPSNESKGSFKRLQVKIQDENTVALTQVMKKNPLANIQTNAYMQKAIDDLNDKDIPRIKMSRPIMKLAYYQSNFWHNHQKENNEFRYTTGLKKGIFKPYNICFYQNKLQTHVKKQLNMELIQKLFPKWKDVKLNQKVGAAFGEIALLQKCRRQAGIFCTQDCEFATISKKNESDFDYLIRYEQRQDELYLKNFNIFNWWIERKKLNEVSHYFEKDKNKTFGDEVYKFGDKVNHIFFLKSGEIELTLKETLPKTFNKSDLNFMVKEFEWKMENRSFKGSFKRVINANHIFGVEELLADLPQRIFSARVKSSECFIYRLPKEKIYIDLMSKGKNSGFLKALQQYSCITNDSLSRIGKIPNLDLLKKRSMEFTSLDYQELHEQLRDRDINHQCRMCHNILQEENIDNGEEQNEYITKLGKTIQKLSEKDVVMSVKNADKIVENQTKKGRWVKKNNTEGLKMDFLKSYNLNSNFYKGRKNNLQDSHRKTLEKVETINPMTYLSVIEEANNVIDSNNKSKLIDHNKSKLTEHNKSKLTEHNKSGNIGRVQISSS